MNHKCVERIYREEGLSVRRRKRKRAAGVRAETWLQATQPDQRWSLDFVSDALWWGRKLRMLTVVDTYTRESLAIEVDTSLSGARVARVLDRVIAGRSTPQEIVMDNGPELTSNQGAPRNYASTQPMDIETTRIHPNVGGKRTFWR